jgi:hypothetical protein
MSIQERIGRFQVGDIVGITSGSPLATIIKAKTWGIKSAFSQDKASHIGTVVDRGQGLLYLAEMNAGGLDLMSFRAYDHVRPLAHICFVGRHPAFDQQVRRDIYNEFMLSAHAHGVRYGFEDLVNFLPGVHFKDNLKTWICSELPREAFRAQGIAYPRGWDFQCAPRDWQLWLELQNITKFIMT